MNPPTIDFGVAEHWVGCGVVVAVWGDLDLATAPKLADAIDAAARKKPAALIVDLTRVDFLASVGMTVLITAHREIAPSARFGVVADGPSTGRPLKMTGIDTIVEVYRSLDEALDKYASS